MEAGHGEKESVYNSKVSQDEINYLTRNNQNLPVQSKSYFPGANKILKKAKGSPISSSSNINPRYNYNRVLNKYYLPPLTYHRVTDLNRSNPFFTQRKENIYKDYNEENSITEQNMVDNCWRKLINKGNPNPRSEERRVGKEGREGCKSRGTLYDEQKKNKGRG